VPLNLGPINDWDLTHLPLRAETIEAPAIELPAIPPAKPDTPWAEYSLQRIEDWRLTVEGAAARTMGSPQSATSSRRVLSNQTAATVILFHDLIVTWPVDAATGQFAVRPGGLLATLGDYAMANEPETGLLALAGAALFQLLLAGSIPLRLERILAAGVRTVGRPQPRPDRCCLCVDRGRYAAIRNDELPGEVRWNTTVRKMPMVNCGRTRSKTLKVLIGDRTGQILRCDPATRLARSSRDARGSGIED
jgi:hypothetical protein